MPSLTEILPPPDQLVQLEPEEVGVFVLRILCLEERQRGGSGSLNRYNFTLDGSLGNYVSDSVLRQEVAKVLTEGWVWLERELMIAPKPGESSGQWFFVTRRGRKANEEANLAAYKNAARLPEGSLDPVLARKVRPLFIRGDYETAIFQAFKEVEVRVRQASGLPDSVYGTDLMRQAFDKDSGSLADMSRLPAERDATAHLFAGAIGLYKNPSSHRDVNFDNPDEAVELILMANHLLRLVDNRAASAHTQAQDAARTG
jgi:uncharacterized protein (TIGR02391 family)